MNNNFDELAKGMAQSVTRRGALKRFSVGLVGMALACLGLPRSANAGTIKSGAKIKHGYCLVDISTGLFSGYCGDCETGAYVGSPQCPFGAKPATFTPCKGGVLGLISSTKCQF